MEKEKPDTHTLYHYHHILWYSLLVVALLLADKDIEPNRKRRLKKAIYREGWGRNGWKIYYFFSALPEHIVRGNSPRGNT